MSSALPFFPKQIEHYVTETVTRETQVQKRLREETSKLSMARMQTTPDQVAFLAMLVRLTGAKYIIEIGTFTGYSALAMASALPEDGKLIACDTSKEWTDIAQRYWKEAGVADRIELHLSPAAETLAGFVKAGAHFDMAFIDADKAGYDAYYEACLHLMKPGGLIAFDNMLWSGAVADNNEQDSNTVALRALNLKIHQDRRVDSCMLTVADGIMLARKR